MPPKSDHEGVTLSVPMCLPTRTVLFFLLVHVSPISLLSLWEIFSAKLKGQGLVTNH